MWIFFGIMSLVFIVAIWMSIEQVFAKSVDCPVCGKRFKLVRGSHPCPKCRTRVVKTKSGEIITTK